MKKKILFKRLVSLVLTLTFAVQCLPANVFAALMPDDSDKLNVVYEVLNDWGTGFTGQLTATNLSDRTLNNWGLEFDAAFNIDSVWNANIIDYIDGRYELINPGYNTTIYPGQSITIGFNGSPGGSKTPSNYTLTFDGGNFNFAWSEPNTGDTDTNSDDDGTDTETANKTGTVFDYALFTNQNTAFYTAYTNIKGNVHTNGSFYYQGTQLTINGKCSAGTTITTQTASSPVSVIKSKAEYAPQVEMDLLCEKAYAYIQNTADISETSVYFNQDQINIENSLISEGNIGFNGSTFTGSGTIYAKGNIEYNTRNTVTADNSSRFIVSENGDITINGTNITLEGVLYAPNGVVRLNVDNFTFNGRIIADSIEFNGTNFNITASDGDLDFIDFLFANQPPIADFELDDAYYLRDPENENKATINITDLSYPPDKDTIVAHEWYVYYDINNDGIFDESELIEIFPAETKDEQTGETIYTYETTNVGKYQLFFVVHELSRYADPENPTDEDYMTGDSSLKPDEEKLFEVCNIAPEALLNIGIAKEIDIVFVADSGKSDTSKLYKEKIEEIETDLAELGFNVNTSVVSMSSNANTSLVDLLDSCDFKSDTSRYVIYLGDGIGFNIDDRYTEVSDYFNGNLYSLVNTPEVRYYNWHQAKAYAEALGGHLVTITSAEEQLFLDELYKRRVSDGFWLGGTDEGTEGEWRWITGEPWGYTNWHGGEPNNAHGGTEHWLGIWQGTKWNDFRLSTSEVSGLIIEWEGSDFAYNGGLLEDYEDDVEIAELASYLLEKELVFIGLGDSEDAEEFTNTINAVVGGIYLDFTSQDSGDLLAGFVVNNELNKEFKLFNDTSYVAVDQLIRYIDRYSDRESDPMYEEIWTYNYTSVDGINDIITTDAPLTRFDKPGEYGVSLSVRDNPVLDNDNLDGYRLWAEEVYSGRIIAHNRPIAAIESISLAETENNGRIAVELTTTAYDPDYPDRADLGISAREFKWKRLHDTSWTNGELPQFLYAEDIYLVYLRVTDIEGGVSVPAVSVISTYGMSERDITPPRVWANIPVTMQVGEEYFIDVFAEDNVAVGSLELNINGATVPLTGVILGGTLATGNYAFTPEEEGDYTFVVTAKDMTGNTANSTKTVPAVKVYILPPVLFVGIIGEQPFRAGKPVTISVNASSYTPTSEITIDVAVNGESIGTGTGEHTFIPPIPGAYEISVKGVDDLGGTAAYKDTIIVVDPNDNTTPFLDIISSTQGAVITAPTDIIGTVTGISRYTLSYAPVGSSEFTVFHEGRHAVENGVLGKFDPTMLQNGYYTIRIDGYASNYTAYAELLISVEGQMKIGNFSIAFRDMDIPINGYPLTVIRGYDSRNRNIKGDFGYGWDLTLSGIKLTESCTPGNHWEQEARSGGGFLPVTTYYIIEEKPHEVMIDWGNGKTDKFKMNISPNQQTFAMIQYGISVSYTAQNGSKSKLEALDIQTADLMYNGGQILYSDTLRPYDPTRYKLTTADGTVYILNENMGVEKITNPNGSELTFTADGIIHSDGKSITFERDSENRITSITDPNGKSVSYTYDANGDLVSVTDVGGAVTRFGYDNKHSLTDIIDPLGRTVSRNEYDENGRLVAVISADGKRIEFNHDVDGRREVITDRLGNATIYTYDERGNVLSLTDALGNTINKTYDTNGYLSTETDAIGNVTNYSYDNQGNLLTLSNAAGSTVTNTYNEKNQITSINAMGVTQFIVRYDEVGNYTATADAMGNVTSYDYDSKNRVTSISDNIGTVNSFTYDSNGNAASMTNGAGQIATFAYDSEGNCISKTITKDGQNLTEHYSYDVYGNLTQVIYHDGSVTNVEYNALGEMTAAADSKNRRTTYEYDLYGNLTKISYSNGTTEVFEYDAMGRNISATDRIGRTVRMTYDAIGNLKTKTYPNGAEESYTYDAKYRLTSHTDINGGTTTYEYDNADRNTAITDAAGNTTYFTYNQYSQLASMKDPNGKIYYFEYDLNGSRTKTTMPDGSYISTFYDARGRIESQTDRNGYVTRYAYDGADRLKSVTDAKGSLWQYVYNTAGELVSVTDANGNTTTYQYDSMGRVTQVTNAAGQTASMTYDSMGNILTSTDYAGIVTTYEYDGNDRLINKSVGGETIIYNYATNGQLSSVTDNNGTTAYTYNSMGILAYVRLYDGNTVSYTYDTACRLTEISTNYGFTRYQYDNMDRLTRVIGHDGLATVYEYDANGNRIAARYANGVVITYTYDDVNRLILQETKDSGNNIIARYAYTLGNAGERLIVEELDRTVEYEYDSLYRLTKETVTDENGISTTIYAYDNNSNRVSKTVDGIVTSYRYNELNQLLSESGGFNISYTYDTNGNLTLKTEGATTTRFAYNAENRLIRATIQSGQNVTVEEYAYDHAGNRISKTTEQETVNYLLDISTPLLAQVLAEFSASGDLLTWYTHGDELLSLHRADEVRYYLHDGHGSVRILTDEKGAITDTYTFDAFGNITNQTGDTENSFLYAGEQYDQTTRLYYLRARYMNPATGTFISMDVYQGSIFDPVSLHKYLYANANPVMYTDPTGYTSYAETETVFSIQGILNSMATIKFGAVLEYLSTNIMTTILFIDCLYHITELLISFSLDFTYEEKEEHIGICFFRPGQIGLRDKSNTRKKAYEKAKKAGGGKEPKHHPHGHPGNRRPHFHPDVAKPQKLTPHMPSSHDHYYYSITAILYAIIDKLLSYDYYSYISDTEPCLCNLTDNP